LWNFENAAIMKGSGQADREPPPFSLGVIPTVEVKGGTLLGSSLIDPSDRPGPVVLEAHNISAELKQVDFDAFTGSGPSLVAEGDLKADSARFGSVPTTNLRSHLRILPRQVFLNNLSVEAHGGRASGDFSFNLAGSKTKFSTNVQASGVDVAYLQAQFPEGRGKMTGKMQGNLKLEGEIEHSDNPLAGIRGSGHIIVRNGALPTLNQNENMMKMTRFRNSGSASRAPASFSTFSADMNMANRRISSHQIDIEFYGIDVQCSGSLGVTGGGGLDYTGVASVLSGQGFFTSMMARMSGAKLEKGKLSFPIRIEGTLQSPKFSVGN
jgi:AsmA-like protein